MKRRKQPTPCTCTTCWRCRQGARVRQAWADGTLARRRKGAHVGTWPQEEEQLLRDLAGTCSLEALRDELQARFGSERTVNAVRVRCGRLGISTRCRGWSLITLRRFFGVDHRTIITWWIETGAIVATRWPGRGGYQGWWIESAAIERFIRACPWAFDAERLSPRFVPRPLQPEARRLAQIAVLIQQSDPWRTRDALSAFMGWESHVGFDRWLKRGLIPHQRRYGAGGQGQIMIRGRDFASIKAAIDDAIRRNRSVAATRRNATIRARREREAA